MIPSIYFVTFPNVIRLYYIHVLELSSTAHVCVCMRVVCCVCVCVLCVCVCVCMHVVCVCMRVVCV